MNIEIHYTPLEVPETAELERLFTNLDKLLRSGWMFIRSNYYAPNELHTYHRAYLVNHLHPLCKAKFLC
jgi:hypothetical protein